jgi:hypothetical protein
VTVNHRVPIESTAWSFWKRVALRSAGFPADLVRRLADPEIAALADAEAERDPLSPGYLKAYAMSWQRLSDDLAGLARTDAFREAVTWQSPHLVERYLDKIAEAPDFGGQPPTRKHRRRLLTMAGYLQRYTVKNDTIGFFGPVGWAWWGPMDSPVRQIPGEGLLARRTVYFERWAVEAVARALLADPDLRALVPPRRSPELFFTGQAVLTPLGKPKPLSDCERGLLIACDGVRTASEIARQLSAECGWPEADLLAAFGELRDRGIVRTEISVPACTRPELVLRERLVALRPGAARDRALDALAKLTTARDRVVASSGAADRLAAALDRLNRCFTAITGEPADRRPGETYAGRTIVYEDTVRDVRVSLGQPLLDELAGPLDLILRSARWFTWKVAEAYRSRFRELFERLSARTGRREVPLAALLSAATPDLAFSYRDLPPLVATCAEDLRLAWEEILRPPAGARRHRVDVPDIRHTVEHRFVAPPPQWSAARQHSPDLMIAARSEAAIRSGDYLAVLSELHVSTNTLQSRVFVAQADDPDELLAAEVADHGRRRVILLPSNRSSGVNSRTHPSALHAPDFTYWTMAADPADEPGQVIPAGALTVQDRAGELVVVSNVDGREFDLLEALGEPLGRVAMNGFKPLGGGAHQPRVTIGKLVIARESWTFEASSLDWANVKDPADRYRRARLWRRSYGLPERCFYLAPGEDKPMYVDFAGVVLVDLLARQVRDRGRCAVRFSEMLPDLRQSWLVDRNGAGYVAELRMVAVDESSGAHADSPG